MKKAIALLGISLFSMMVFTNTNVLASTNDLDLASLITLNKADAECNPNVPVETKNGKCNWTGERCYSQIQNLPSNDCSTFYNF